MYFLQCGSQPATTTTASLSDAGNKMGIDRATPGTAAVILDSSRRQVVLHLRDDQPMWSLPGGPPEFGESFTATTIREVKNETGLNVKIVQLIGVYSEPEFWIFEYPDGNRAHAFAAAFEYRKPQRL